MHTITLLSFSLITVASAAVLPRQLPGMLLLPVNVKLHT